MTTAGGSIQLKVSKSTLSMFLRTKCDKELFLSLHDKTAMAGAGLPEPIKRPGIGILAVHGKEFEVVRNDQLVRLFGGIVRYSKSTNQYGNVDLQAALSAVISAPQLILQGLFSIGAQQPSVLSTIGIDASDIPLVPPITDFIPDILYIRNAQAGDQEVLPDGARGPIDELLEARKAICVLDIKHTAEANPSYCSEIAMYTVMLANWLQAKPQLASRFFVSLDARLWTRHNQVGSELDKVESRGGATQQELLDALIVDSEDAQLRFYLPTIRSFFTDVARVMRIGQTPGQGWQALEWHISGSCSACDWLGDRRHMGPAHRGVVDRNPGHYCMPLAESTGHLCLVPGITRGAKKVLQQNTVADTSALAGAVGHPALQQHTLLKKEAKAFPARSAAINSGNVSRDATGTIASLVRSANILLYASINFDSSSGFLTGLALSGTATTFTVGQPPRRFRPVPFIVDDKTLQAEWVALEGFLTQIASWIEAAEQMKGGASITGQVHFWEQRQFQELCNAMGRHLPRVLALSARRAKALAWVFAADEMLERADAVEAATIVTVEDIVRRLVFAPSRHVITLFDTVERYRRGTYSPAITDSYYREYLSNGIPRERIYELWAHTPQVKRGATSIPRNTLIAQYSDALERQSSALEAVCEKLREDYRGQFRAKEARIPVSVPRGASNVAFDAKLWLWWDELDFNTSQLEAHIALSMDGERLEATYEAIVLQGGVHLSGDLYQFNVAPSSSEAKFKEDSRLTIGKVGMPGMPLQRVGSIVSSGAPFFQGAPEVLQMPLWSAVEARLVSFDRVRLVAQVEIACRREPNLVPYLMQYSTMPLMSDIFLVEAKKPKMFNWAELSQPILQAIGNPRIAVPDPNAVRAIGVAPPARRTFDAETPAARVLWAPGTLQQQVVLAGATAGTLADAVCTFHSLNKSQRDAIAHALERQLTVIWGPPGTGKTNTLAAMLHAMTVHAVASNTPLRVLVTGPTYKAVEEVMHRAAKFLSKDPTARCAMYVGYSRGRALGAAPQGLASHITYNAMIFENGNAEWQGCTQLLAGDTGVTIVGCQVMHGRQFAKALGTSALHPVFDVVVVDESSQVPVAKSLAAFSGLRDDARVVVAGDHLQMPPITAIEAPKEAAYLVGSIQTYLLERPFAVPVQKCVLDTNYRSADHIVEFARTIGYPPGLTAAYGNCRLHLVQPLPSRADYYPSFPWSQVFDRVLHPDTRVASVLHDDDISSQGNRYEAQVVANLVRGLRHSVSGALDNWGLNSKPHSVPGAQQFWSECVGIVTPHRAQRALVVQALTDIWPTEADHISDAVDTVERFQGGERHTIIVTFGVADVDVISGEETFLMQLERTNVAISRAMAKCIVVMPRALAAHVPEDKRALETAFAIKDFVEDFCSQRVDDILQSPAGNRGVQVRFRP
ncbi:TPA: AAA family ATPase [Pseudomonas aeruginosa]|nr:AAA family ATPase [Pseudomonas aeruginosa]